MLSLELEVNVYISLRRGWLTAQTLPIGLGVMVMVFNTTFNNISVISWRSVLFTDLPPNTDKMYIFPTVTTHV
jgi:hypothetical protein